MTSRKYVHNVWFATTYVDGGNGYSLHAKFLADTYIEITGQSLRSGDATAWVRMDAINAENMTQYFDVLKLKEVCEFNSYKKCVYNMDVTGVPLEL